MVECSWPLTLHERRETAVAGLDTRGGAHSVADGAVGGRGQGEAEVFTGVPVPVDSLRLHRVREHALLSEVSALLTLQHPHIVQVCAHAFVKCSCARE
jgi:hypothetical protein